MKRILLSACVASALLGFTAEKVVAPRAEASNEIQIQINAVEKDEDTKELEELLSRVPETLWRISYCETTVHHTTPDGGTIRGVVDSDDTGLFQINKRYHLADATRMGFSLEELTGNIRYATALFRNQGATPWKWSYNPKEDQCVNGLKMPPRASKEWESIKNKAIGALIANEKEQ